MKYFFPALIFSLLFACGKVDNQRKLPVYGNKKIEGGDTLFHTISDFEFVNQDSIVVTYDDFRDKIYVADFFFTSCPDICPRMKTQMLRVYDSIQNYNDVILLSHTIDPEHDSVAVLKDFSERLGIVAPKWHMVTGEKDEIYEQSRSYLVLQPNEDASAPGGFVHDGSFILVDKQGRIRGAYDGTLAPQVDRLIKDIKILRQEYEN